MTAIKFIKKRTGDLQEFDPEKISNAIKKAFLSATGSSNDFELKNIANAVVEKMEKIFGEDQTPTVENVQNIVEQTLMEKSHFNIAKSYIIYRYEHRKKREEKKKEIIEKIEKSDLFVIKKSGTKQPFSMEKLQNSIKKYAGDDKTIDIEKVANQCRSELYDNIPTAEISKALVLCARSFIETDPAYSKLASKILLDILYKQVLGEKINFGELKKQHSESFKKNIIKGVEIGKLDPKMLVYDLEKMTNAMDLSRDDELDYLGLQTLYDRYFLSNAETKEILETPQMFWMRVAMGLALNEKNRNEKAISFYNIVSTLRLVPSTPTLFHSGTMHPQLSSCYLTTIEDSLDHIFKCFADNAQLSKWSGGIGNDWTNLRGIGALIKGTGVESQGIVPFLKIANDTTVAINRSGKRRGATCAYLEVWHYDIEDFLELRRNTGDERRRAHDMDIAVWTPDLFMKRVEEDGNWTLFSPDETSDLHHIYGKNFEEAYKKYEEKTKKGEIRLWKTIKARDLWKKMLSMLFETGHPWITFKDPCNLRSPQDHTGVVHCSNLCTEITLNTSSDETAVCNLASVNLSKHIKNNRLDVESLKETVSLGINMLDNVIELNFYPTKEARNSNTRHRPIGLGIMGYQDALYSLNIPFDSEKNIQFADESMELISFFAISASAKLAKEKGAYPSFKGSKWDRGIFPLDTLAILENERGKKIEVNKNSRLDWAGLKNMVKEYGLRNSNCMAIAPTATISNISGCFPTIEPAYKNIFVKSNMSGEFTMVNQYLVEDLKKLNLWNKEMLDEIKRYDGNISTIDVIPREIREKYKEVFDIPYEWLIKSAAHRGKWVDQSQSLNLFIKGVSGKKLSDMYMYAWKMGLKTTYYLRSTSASNLEKSTLDIKKQENLTKATPVETPTEEPKLCKIEDPNCEACQ